MRRLRHAARSEQRVVYAQVGLVTLVGLVSKNGILIVQFANELQRRGLPKLEAVREAHRIRVDHPG